jgi:hypothetical protein
MVQTLHQVVKVLQLAIAVAVAAGLVYRSQTYTDALNTGVTGPVMCSVFAVLLLVTSITVIFRPRQAW